MAYSIYTNTNNNTSNSTIWKNRQKVENWQSNLRTIQMDESNVGCKRVVDIMFVDVMTLEVYDAV